MAELSSMTNCWLGGLFLQPRRLYFKMLKVWVSFPYFECYYINDNISYYWPLRVLQLPWKHKMVREFGRLRWILTRSALYWHDRTGHRNVCNQLQSMTDILGPLGPTNEKNTYWVVVSWPYPVSLCSLLFPFSEVLILLCFQSKLMCTMVLYCFAF